MSLCYDNEEDNIELAPSFKRMKLTSFNNCNAISVRVLDPLERLKGVFPYMKEEVFPIIQKLAEILGNNHNNIDLALKFIHNEKKKDYFMSKDSVNLHSISRKRKMNERQISPPIDDLEEIFREIENIPLENTRVYLKIKISEVVGKLC